MGVEDNQEGLAEIIRASVQNMEGAHDLDEIGIYGAGGVLAGMHTLTGLDEVDRSILQINDTLAYFI